MIKQIISGGQTGADQGGLFGATKAGVLTGGWAPMGWWTENGRQESVLELYGLHECNRKGYPARTRLNVECSDGTVIFGRIASPGSQLTLKFCKDLDKPFCHIPVLYGKIKNPGAMDFFKDWIEENKIEILNVAGNRESANKGIYRAVAEFIYEALKD